MPSIRDTGTEDKLSESEGIFFEPGLPDDELCEALMKAVTESETWWNAKKGFNLAEVRKKNVNLWLPNHLDDTELYPHEEDNSYVDPRIFLSVETIISIVAGRLPQPDAYPASDSTTSYQLATDVQDGLGAWAEEHQLLDIFRGSIRTDILERIGVVKLEWNENYGKHGDIIPILVDVNDLIFDHHARKGENPRFIAHKQAKSVDDWVSKFPSAKKKIYDALGIKKGVLSQRAKREVAYEVWFTWFDKSNKPQESIAWLMNNKVIAKTRHPHWVYEDEQMSDSDKNILQYPDKPFFAINYLNRGKHVIDDTTLVEQAASLQRILEKRGRQLSQNADDASGGLVINGAMIDKNDAAQLTGDPQEKIISSGDVRAAVARIAPAQLPAYVLEDKLDSRDEIDNVFSTHAPIRGEQTNSKTLGQDYLQHQQDMTRLDDLVRSVEFMAAKLYKYVVQMMKVHYTEEHLMRMSGDNGRFNFVMLKNDKIEDGLDIRVRSGSTLPLDRAALRTQAIQLSQSGLIDPLTLYETLQFPEPQKMVERLVNYTNDPGAYIKEFKAEDYERDAFANIQIINAGMEPQEVKEPSQEYLAYYRNYMMSGEFQDLPDEVKSMHVEHVREVTDRLAKITALRETQLPSQDEMQEANKKEVEMAAMQQAMAGGAAPAPTAAPMMPGQGAPEQNVV